MIKNLELLEIRFEGRNISFFQLLQVVVLSAFNVAQQKINENQREFGPWISTHKTGNIEIK